MRLVKLLLEYGLPETPSGDGSPTSNEIDHMFPHLKGVGTFTLPDDPNEWGWKFKYTCILHFPDGTTKPYVFRSMSRRTPEHVGQIMRQEGSIRFDEYSEEELHPPPSHGPQY